MNCCREITKIGVQPGNSSRGTAGLVSVTERYVAGGACPACPERSLGEPVEGTPEDLRKDGHIRGRSR